MKIWNQINGTLGCLIVGLAVAACGGVEEDAVGNLSGDAEAVSSEDAAGSSSESGSESTGEATESDGSGEDDGEAGDEATDEGGSNEETGTESVETPEEGGTGEEAASTEVDGKALYEQLCSTCHGLDGKSGTVNENITTEPLSHVMSAMMNGKKSMPAFSYLSQEELDAIADYVVNVL